MDLRVALQAYDQQLRRATDPPAPGWTVDLLEHPAPMLRLTAPGGLGWHNGIVWTDLDEQTADAAIESVIAHFAALGRAFEWKHHGYDTPADLPARLLAAGFESDEEEALVIGEVAEVRARLASRRDPEGVTLRHIRPDESARDEDWAAIDRLKATVWGRDAGEQTRALAAEHAADPTAMSVWLAQSPEGEVVSAAWVRFHAGTDFASLWGGSTLPQWRGRGIYTALVSRRAEEAAARGARYLQVDASPQSRPILERLGLHLVTSTTPWMWRP